jgi:hypothetical protein
MATPKHTQLATIDAPHPHHLKQDVMQPATLLMHAICVLTAAGRWAKRDDAAGSFSRTAAFAVKH